MIWHDLTGAYKIYTQHRSTRLLLGIIPSLVGYIYPRSYPYVTPIAMDFSTTNQYIYIYYMYIYIWFRSKNGTNKTIWKPDQQDLNGEYPFWCDPFDSFDHRQSMLRPRAMPLVRRWDMPLGSDMEVTTEWSLDNLNMGLCENMVPLNPIVNSHHFSGKHVIKWCTLIVDIPTEEFRRLVHIWIEADCSQLMHCSCHGSRFLLPCLDGLKNHSLSLVTCHCDCEYHWWIDY